MLGGELDLDLQEDLTPGAALTIATGRSLTGTFAGLPEGSFLRLGDHVFWKKPENYWLVLSVAVVSYVIIRRLVRSRP